jgi:hypothetical protein
MVTMLELLGLGLSIVLIRFGYWAKEQVSHYKTADPKSKQFYWVAIGIGYFGALAFALKLLLLFI